MHQQLQQSQCMKCCGRGCRAEKPALNNKYYRSFLMDMQDFDNLPGFEDFSEIYASVFGEVHPEETFAEEEELSPPENDEPEDAEAVLSAEDVLADDAAYEQAAEQAFWDEEYDEPEYTSAQAYDASTGDAESTDTEEDAGAEEPPEFDPRFNIDRRSDGKPRRRDYSYNGNRVSTTQELDYVPKDAPEYEELRSSYTAADAYDALFASPEEDDPSAGKKKAGLFKKKKPQPLAEEPAEKQEKPRMPSPIKKLKEEKPFARLGKSLTQEDQEYAFSDDLESDLDRDGSFTPLSFGKFLSARIAGVLLKLRGNVPEGTPSGTMAEEAEDLGPELSAMNASKYYGSQVYSLRMRTRIACILFLIMTYISLGLPVPGMLQYLRVATASVMALQFTIMLLSLDVVSNAIFNAVRLKFGADTLALFSCILTSLDAMAVLNAESVYRHMPLCAVSSLTLIGVLFSSLLSARGIRKALRVPAIGKQVYSVTAESGITGRDITILKSSRPINGFIRRTEEAPIDETAFRKAGPFLLVLTLVLAIISAVAKKSFSNILYIYSVIFAPAVPFTALLAFALPYFVGTQRIFSSGASLAGWSGVSDIGYSKNLIVTDRDLFPPENIEIENVRIFADYDSEKVISYAGSLILSSECGISQSFEKLMNENNCSTVAIDNLEFLAGGGIKGMAEGHVILCGSSDLMRLMDVRIPYRLVSNTSVLLAIDGVLYGIFNMKYTADPKVRKALVSLMRSNRHPIFAIRDFNITPEFIHDCFDVATDGYDFPPYVDRFPISEAKPSADSQISAVICREGLGPLTDVADTGRSIFVVSRLNTVISLATALLGVFISFFRIMISGSASVGATLLIVALFSLPVLILGLFTTSVN